MKKVVLALLISNFVFAGQIVPIIKRNNVQRNDGPLGTAWTKRNSQLGVALIQADEDGHSDLSHNQYGDMFRSEIDIYNKVNNSESNLNLAWNLDTWSIGFALYDDGVGTSNDESTLGFGFKRDNDIYYGIGIKTLVDDTATANATYFGIGQYIDEGEDKKISRELVITISPGDYQSAEDDDVSKFTDITGSWTQIFGDYQINWGVIYQFGNDGEDTYDYDLLAIFGELEKRISDNLFIEFTLANYDVNYDYKSGSTSNVDIFVYGANARYKFNDSHQLTFNFYVADATFGNLYIDGTTYGLGYNYIY